MSPPPSRDQFSDPNEHLLASVIPPPPPTLRARAQQLLTRLRQRDRLRVLDWSRSREGRACFLAALAGGALMLGLYRSGASSGMNAGGATLRSEPSPAAGSERPRALEPERAHAALLPAARASAVEPKSSPPRAAGDDPERADATSAAASLGSTQRHAGADETKAAKKKKRRAKQRAVRRKHTRATRRSKARRAKAARPVAGWLASQRSKKASDTD